LIADEAFHEHVLDTDIFQDAQIPVPAQIPDVAITNKVLQSLFIVFINQNQKFISR